MPFCAHRCGYCDFTLVARRDDLIDAYLEALAIDLAQLGEPREVDTLFFGGGTPTHLPAVPIGTFDEAGAALVPSGCGGRDLRRGQSGGAGRREDRRPGRGRRQPREPGRAVVRCRRFSSCWNATTVEPEIVSAVERLRPAIPNIGFDLIFGIPGQSLDLWKETLDEAIRSRAHAPVDVRTDVRERDHVLQPAQQRHRCGGATRSPNAKCTPWRWIGLPPPDSSSTRSPISPGPASVRVTMRFTGRDLPFFGFGPGAARYIAGRRELNHRSVTTWIKRVRAGQSPIADSGRTVARRAGPRTRHARPEALPGGIDLAEFRAADRLRFPPTVARSAFAASPTTDSWKKLTDRCRLTREGRFVADTVIVDFL